MKRMWLKLSIGAIAIASSHAVAQPVSAPTELPAAELASAWMDSDLRVQQARSNLVAAGHAGAAIAASPNEWVGRAQAQRRRYRDEGVNSNEWSVSLERTIRINGKAGLDVELGRAGEEVALAQYAEARHESARALATLWIDVIAAAQQQRVMADQVRFAEVGTGAVEKRKRAGDASELELNAAKADLGEMRRQASIADGQYAKARAQLLGRFPKAQLPTSPELPEPSSPAWPLERWQEQILAQSDVVRLADAELRKAQLSARRASADRVPDPTFGVYTSSEARSNERIVGISLSIPISGSYRKHVELQALQDAETSRVSGDRERQAIATEVTQLYLDASAGVNRWRLAQDAANLTRDSARRTLRGYELGEVELASLLAARRASLDAERGALDARSDALRANHRLLLDAHLIWGLDQD